MPESVIHHGDCREIMATFEPCSVDAIVTDPPYGLEFMGKDWDRLGKSSRASQKPSPAQANFPMKSRARSIAERRNGPEQQQWHEAWAAEAFRVLKPGGYLLAFGGTRTFHRLTCAIEDAGFEIRDCLSWLYGSGFPKSLDVSKAIDKAAGAERIQYQTNLSRDTRAVRLSGNAGITCAICGETTVGQDGLVCGHPKDSGPATDAAREWSGWGTALKPAWEPIILARKPLAEPTVASNVLRHGTGAINVDGCRIEATEDRSRPP